MTISELHSLAARKIERSQLHCRLHDMAVAKFKVGSLSQLSPDQLEQLARFVRSLPDAPSSKVATRNANTGRSGVYYDYSPRKRPGTQNDPNLVMISGGQRELIYKLANEMQWPATVFYRWLEVNFRLKHPDEIRTSKQAKDVIQALIYRKRQQEHPQPAKPARSTARPWGNREEKATGTEAQRLNEEEETVCHRPMSRAAAFFADKTIRTKPASVSSASAPLPLSQQPHKEVPGVQQSLFT